MGPFISGLVDNHEAAAAETRCGLIDHGEGKPGGNSGVDSVTAPIKNLRSSLRCQRVVRNNDAGAALLGIGRECHDKEKEDEEKFCLELGPEEHTGESLSSIKSSKSSKALLQLKKSLPGSVVMLILFLRL